MKKTSCFRFLPPFLGITLFLCAPELAGGGVRSGLALCVEVLIPALFPVSVLARCLLQMGYGIRLSRLCGAATERLWGISGSAAAPILLGLLGGFPLGAQLLSAAYRDRTITKRDAIRASALCNNAGPGFLIGAVPAILGSQGLGFALLGIQLISLFLVGMLLRERTPAQIRTAPAQPTVSSFSEALPNSIGASAAAMLRLCGSVCFFRALTACADRLWIGLRLPSVWKAACIGFLELSGGAALWARFPVRSAFLLASVLIPWGGLCVHLQAAEAFRSAALPLRRYFLGKLLQAGISGFLAFLLLSFCL